MSMFPNQPKAKKVQAPAPSIPDNAKVSFVVKYRGGRKPFDTKLEAMLFAKDERDKENGWAEVSKVIETIESPR